jgi:hypothetical protein
VTRLNQFLSRHAGNVAHVQGIGGLREYLGKGYSAAREPGQHDSLGVPADARVRALIPLHHGGAVQTGVIGIAMRKSLH